MPRGKRSKGRHAVGAPRETSEEFVSRVEELKEEELLGSAGTAPEPPRGSRRAQARKKRRRSFGMRVLAGVATGALVAGVLVGGPYLARKTTEDPNEDAGSEVAAAPATPTTTLVYGTRERDGGSEQEAIWLMLFTYDPRDEKGSVVQIPAHTAAEIPGRGVESLTGAYSSGGVPLLLVSLENLLGVQIDRYLELSDRDARVLLSATGPLDMNVPEDVRVPAGSNKVRLAFVAGRQEVAAQGLVRLLYTRGVDVDDIDFGTRQIAFWDAIFDRFDNDPAALGQAITKAAAALGESDVDVQEHARFFRALAGLPRVALTLTALPVRGIAAGVDELYATDADELEEFAVANLEDGRSAEDEVRVQILNGNGEPGIGQEVADILVPEGFRVILSGNAMRMDYGKTLIVTYDSSAEGQALAERARRLLGVGEVQVSVQQQGIVDLTIVVGEDFLTTL